VHLAAQRVSSESYNIGEFHRKEAEDALFWIQQIRHESFVKALEAFVTYNVLYVVLEEMNITLYHPEAISFVAATTSARSVTELKEILCTKSSHTRPTILQFLAYIFSSPREKG
jgi:hypothetical protein